MAHRKQLGTMQVEYAKKNRARHSSCVLIQCGACCTYRVAAILCHTTGRVHKNLPNRVRVRTDIPRILWNAHPQFDYCKCGQTR